MAVSLYTVLYLYTALFNPVPFFLILTLLSFVVYKERGLRVAFFFVLTLACAAASTLLIKNALAIPRPEGNLLGEDGYGFPSLHATVATLFFLLILHILLPAYRGYKKYVFAFLCLFSAVMVSVSRVLFQVHSVEQVLWGVAFGLFWALMSIHLKRAMHI